MSAHPAVAEPLRVQIWSDYICPFCHVARERAAWLHSEYGAQVEWLPFDLHPEYPPDGLARPALVARYGEAFVDTVRTLSEESGLVYNPHPDVVPNSRRALELTEWARTLDDGSHTRLHDALMDAYWVQARDITLWDVLVPVADGVGLDGAKGREAVESGGFARAVDASTDWARQAGITAVPAFVFDGRLLVSGVVPHEGLAEAVDAVRNAQE